MSPSGSMMSLATRVTPEPSSMVAQEPFDRHDRAAERRVVENALRAGHAVIDAQPLQASGLVAVAGGEQVAIDRCPPAAAGLERLERSQGHRIEQRDERAPFWGCLHVSSLHDHDERLAFRDDLEDVGMAVVIEGGEVSARRRFAGRPSAVASPRT